MKQILNRLINHEQLSKEEARNVLVLMSEGKYNSSQIAAFLTVYLMRSVSIDELEGFRDALLDLCVPVQLEAKNTIDLCGTGGDGKNTFNISTLASFVTAGAGIPVTKHGNYGVSSISGSSNVMEQLGIAFSNDASFLNRCIDEAGICILHAPLFHPAMKHVAPIRKELGVKTFFNMLGPMVNPANPTHQLVGVFSLELARKYGYLYQKGKKNYAILHATDGYDEISLTGATKLISNQSETVITPQTFGIPSVSKEEIRGGETLEGAAQIFKTILSGQGTVAQNHVVCANAGVAISTATGCSLSDGFESATHSLESGKANQAFKKLQQLSATL